MNTEPEREEANKRESEELEVTALYKLTLMGTQKYTHCLERNCAKPLNHRMIAAKPQTCRTLCDTEGTLAHREQTIRHYPYLRQSRLLIPSQENAI